MPLPLTLEISQGRGESRQFPVMVKSLSARGVILATYLAPDDLNLEGSVGQESIIHLSGGEISKVRGSLLWARPRGPGEPEVVFGLELSNSNLKVRRALEEQLLAYPQDLKNLWDHWDAIYEDHEFFRAEQPAYRDSPKTSRLAAASARSQAAPPQDQPAVKHSDPTYYWVGAGAVLAGVGFYFLAPETYRLFGVILAAYGSLTIAGKSVWAMFSNRSQLRE